MIQINLIPDIKAEFLKAEKLKTTVIAGSVIVSTVLLIGLAAMFSYANVTQPKHTENLQADIDAIVGELTADETAIKAVTIDNQLMVLPDLHSQKPAVYRVADFLSKTVPADVQIDSFMLDFENGTILLEGAATGSSRVESAKNANIFVDTIKNASYVDKSVEDFEAVRAFNEVKLESIATTSDDGNQTTFTLSFAFATELFDKGIDVSLSVPSLSSDDTTFNRDENLFEETITEEQVDE